MITNLQMVEQAYRDLANGIKYEDEDCARWIRYCYKRAGGGSVKYSGASDMFRNAGTAYPINKNTWAGLIPGELLFIEDKSINGASHVGLYVGNLKCLHSSFTHDKLVESTNMTQWTHAMRWKLIQYEDATVGTNPAEDINVPANHFVDSNKMAVVLQPVRLRKSTDTTSSKNVIRQLGIGDQLDVLGITERNGAIWANLEQTVGKVTYRGWACVEDAKTRYIALPDVATAVPDVPGEMVTESPPIDRRALERELDGLVDRAKSIITTLMAKG